MVCIHCVNLACGGFARTMRQLSAHLCLSAFAVRHAYNIAGMSRAFSDHFLGCFKSRHMSSSRHLQSGCASAVMPPDSCTLPALFALYHCVLLCFLTPPCMKGNLAMDVLALVPIRSPTPAQGTKVPQEMVQQLLLNATHSSSSSSMSAADQQGEGEEHVGAQLRAHMLRQLLMQWSSSSPPAGTTASSIAPGALLESSRPVVIDLALPNRQADPTPRTPLGVGKTQAQSKGRKKRKVEATKGEVHGV